MRSLEEIAFKVYAILIQGFFDRSKYCESIALFVISWTVVNVFHKFRIPMYYSFPKNILVSWFIRRNANLSIRNHYLIIYCHNCCRSLSFCVWTTLLNKVIMTEIWTTNQNILFYKSCSHSSFYYYTNLATLAIKASVGKSKINSAKKKLPPVRIGTGASGNSLRCLSGWANLWDWNFRILI